LSQSGLTVPAYAGSLARTLCNTNEDRGSPTESAPSARAEQPRTGSASLHLRRRQALPALPLAAAAYESPRFELPQLQQRSALLGITAASRRDARSRRRPSSVRSLHCLPWPHAPPVTASAAPRVGFSLCPYRTNITSTNLCANSTHRAFTLGVA